MASLFQSLWLFPLAILLLLPASALSASIGEAYIEKICNQIEDAGFCNKTFYENLPSPSIADLKALTDVTIVQSSAEGTRTRALISSLIPGTPDGPERRALVACENAYALVLQMFELASEFFHGQDYKNMIIAEGKAAIARQSCTYSKNPAADQDREMRILITMSNVTANYLVQN